MSDHGLFRELDPLLAELVEGELTPDRQLLLAALLRDNPAARAKYVECMVMDSLLSWELDRAERGPGEVAATLDLRVVAEDGGTGEPGFDSIQGNGTPLPGVRPIRRGRVPGLWKSWAAGAAVAASVAVLLVWLAGRPRPEGQRQPPSVAGTPTQVAPLSIAAEDVFAFVIELADARWEEAGRGTPTPTVGDRLAAGRLGLRSGRATLALMNGVTLTLEGPADIDLVSVDRVFCRQGKLRAQVPSGAEGFVVATPGSAVVDLGTEFAVNVTADGMAQVMVFEGEAEVMTRGEPGMLGRTQKVEESQAFEIDARTTQIGRVAAHPRDFAAAPRLTTPPLRLAPSYPDAVLASRPWGYWRFETMADGVIPNEIAGRPPLRATGEVQLSDAEGTGRSAVFKAMQKGNHDYHYLMMDDRWEPRPEPGYAVELWAMPAGIRHSTLASLITDGPPGTSPHLFALELTASELRSLNPPASVRFLHRWPPGPMRGDNLFSPGLYVPYRWHHVVAQFVDHRLEIYLDGVACRSAKLETDDLAVPAQLVLGRLHTLSCEPTHPCRTFCGLLDEVAVYDRPLSAEEIQGHYRLSFPPGAERPDPVARRPTPRE